MNKILFLCSIVGFSCVCCYAASSKPPAPPQKQIVAPDDGVAPRWEKPKTTRRYLHGPLSERLLTFWREGKLVFAENEHSADWRLPYAKQSAHAAWLVRGDGTPFDFKAAELNVTVGGEPDHSQFWMDNGVCVRLSACAPFGRKPSVFARASFSNEGAVLVTREFLVLLRCAPEKMLIHSGPDVYSFYEADVKKWLDIVASDWHRDGDAFRNGDRFVSFRSGEGTSLSWDSEKGGVRFSVQLKPGETKCVDFTLGRGEESAVSYDAARSAMKASWNAELSRLVLPETARRDRERKKLIRHLAVQMLQCIGMPANGAGHVLPRQGGLQRLVWPGESIHVVIALDLLGLSNYADEICDFYMKHCMQDSGEAGPFRNNWAGDTAYVLRIFAQHCFETRNTAMWHKYSTKAAKAFAWIRAKRTADGLFPAMKSTDSASGLQHWGHTDLVNMEALEWYAKACEMFEASNAPEVRAEWKDYRATIVKILDGWRKKSKGKDELFLPITATGEREEELVKQGFFYLHPAGFAESGLLTSDELLRLRTNILRRGFANENGLYMRHPSPVPEFNRHVWYTTWSEKQWMAAWMRAGKFDLAQQALDATLKYSVSDEFIVGERYHDTNPWYFPWSPNASGSGRIVQMLFNSPEIAMKKWIIASGFDIMHARLEDYERKAKDIAALGIDGISVAIRGVWPDDGKERKLGDPMHGRQGEEKPISIRQADFSRSQRIVSKMVKEHLPKSMLRVGLTSKNRIDWRDDEAWAVAADNLAFLAEFARDTGLVGIAFDEEDYSKGKQFFKVKGDPPDAELTALVRKRGRQVFEAVFRAYPDMIFHSSWLYSTIQKWHAWVTPEFGLDQVALAASFGELWGFFMNGAIDAMPPEATIVEGNEERGYHGNADKNEFVVAAWRTSRGSISQIAPENRKKFLSQLSVSFGQYNDSYVNSSKSEYYFPPLGGSRLKRWHENLQSAVTVADDYVWIYGEKGTYVNWERDLSKAPGVDTERCYYQKTWEEQLPGFSRMLKIVKGDYSVLDEDVKSGRMVRVGGLDSTWTKDKDAPKDRFERNIKPGLSKEGYARQNGSGCFCSRVKVKAGDELYIKASVKGQNPMVSVSFLAEGKFDFNRFGRPRTVVPHLGWQHDQWQDLKCHVLVPEGVTEASITFGGSATADNPNCFDCVGIYKTQDEVKTEKAAVYDADVWPNIIPETWSGSDAEARAEGKVGVHDFTVRACAPGETIDWSVPKKVRVQNVKGRPQFTVDGKPVYALWGTVRSDREVRHSTAPLNFVTVWNSSRKWWPRADAFDPAEIDRKAKWHIDRYPDSMLIWDITINPPLDWCQANPDEIVHDEKGAMNKRSSASVGISSVNYSFASDKAIDLMMKAAERAIRHIEGSPYANRIAGYRINSGHTAEWLGWDSVDKEAALDFAPVAKRKFVEFAKEFYPELTNYSIPTMAERTLLDSPYSVVWEMPKHLRSMAYYDFYSRAMADCAIRMCARAREVVGENKLIGTYFGYVMTLMEYGSGQMKAHFSTKRLLDGIRGKVDFLMSPPAYEYWNRGLGDTLMDMKPFASIADHGIMPVVEDDTRTYRNLALKSNGYSQGRTHAHTVSLMRRNMGIAICRGMPFYTYAITSGSEFDYPQFAEDAAALRRFGDRALARGATRKAQIAVVISEEAIKATPDLKAAKAECLPIPVQWYPQTGKVVRRTETYGRPFASDVYGRLCSRMARIGTPVDYRLAEDIADNPGDYKMYVFPNALLNCKAVVAAAKKLRERNCMIVWTYAPGFVSRKGNSVASMKELTGMEFAKVEKAMDSKINTVGGTSYGATGHVVEPLFKAMGNVEVLGKYSNGDCAFAAAKTGNAQSIFYGSYFLELPVLCDLAKRAGVHIYSDATDPMEAGGSFVTLHARFAGRKTVRLPRRTSVYDVFSGKVVAKDVKEFSFNAPLHSSWLFYCADDADSVPSKK